MNTSIFTRIAKDFVFLFFLFIFIFIFYSLLFWRIFFLFPWDISIHNDFAYSFTQTGKPSTVHFLYHAMLISLTDLGLGWDQAAIVLLVCAQCLSSAIIYLYIRKKTNESIQPSPLVALVLSIALLLVGPLWFARLPLPDMAFGWIMPTTLHNPTQLWLRPLALGTFLALSRALQGWRFSRLELFIIIIVVLLCVWMKPNYVLCALPALVPLVVWRRIKGQALDLRALGLMTGVLVGSLALQLVWLRAIEGEVHGFVLAPLAGAAPFSPTVWAIFYKVILSLPFPIISFFFIIKKLSPNERPALCLAALSCGLGVVQMLLLAEVGPRVNHGNWFWGAQVALWVWFVAMTRALACQPSSTQARLLWGLLALHVLGGMFYIGYILLAQNPFYDMLISSTL